MKSYGEFCSMAKALDIVGDRWTLLIIRELTLRGRSRYTDMRAGLPGIATNLLADRLRELEHAGIITREEEPPPVARTMFSLTERGQQLRPILDGLARWGLPLMLEEAPNDVVHSHWLAWALQLMLSDRQPERPPVTVELRIADQPIVIEASGGAVATRLGPEPQPDVTITGQTRPVLGLVLGLTDLDAARAAGVTYTGDPTVVDRLRQRRDTLEASTFDAQVPIG